MEELAEESRRIKALISREEAAEIAELEQVRREGRRLVGIGNSKKSDAEKAASRAMKAAGAEKAADYDEAWLSLATLDQEDYDAAMALKAEGNVLFGAGKPAEAIAKYDAALSQYGAVAARKSHYHPPSREHMAQTMTLLPRVRVRRVSPDQSR